MKKNMKPIIFIGLLLIGFTAACNLVAMQPPTEAPASTASATQAASSPTATLAVTVPAVSATPEFAPFCESGTAAASSSLPECQFPVAEESSTYCKEKDPYNLILINKGLTYEMLTKGFRCLDAGMKDEKQMVACTGPLAREFELNVCDPACVVPTVEAAITKCPQGYNYDDLQGCCTKEIQVLNRNCKTFKFKTTTCVINCRPFNNESKCKRNSYACEWNDKDKICQLRK